MVTHTFRTGFQKPGEFGQTVFLSLAHAYPEKWAGSRDYSVFTMHSLSPSSFFLEKNMQQFFLKILSQKCGRFVCLQLLQTLSILFENIRNETSICELLSTGILYSASDNHILCCLQITFSPTIM